MVKPSYTKKVRQILKLILINYAFLITTLITVELVGQYRHKKQQGYFIFEDKPIDIIFKEHPYLSGVGKQNASVKNYSGSKKITLNSSGYRITGGVQGAKTNVILMGGSTTFGTGVSDEDTWAFYLQNKLGNDYNVVNLGLPGYSTMEEIIQLFSIVPSLDPNIIVHYQGWNDIRNYHSKDFTPDYRSHGAQQKSNLRLKHLNKKRFIENFYWFNLSKKLSPPLKKTNKNTIQYFTADPRVDSIYKRNLSYIQLISNSLNLKNIYVNQVLNIDSLNNCSEDDWDWWTPHIYLNALPGLMSGFNQIMNDVIVQNSSTVLIDSIYLKVNFNNSDFVDLGHFSKKGGDKFSDLLAKEILKINSSHQ